MHFALPSRNVLLQTPTVPRPGKPLLTRRDRLAQVAAAVFGLLVLARLLLGVFGREDDEESIPPGTPLVVLVTVIDRSWGSNHIEMVMENRRAYAELHDYATFFPDDTDYDLSQPPCPRTWAKLPAMRHAMTLFPRSTYFFFLDHHALIMNSTLLIEDHIMAPPRLDSIMLVDTPVGPPDGVIRTFRHGYAGNVNFVIAQDAEGLSQTSFILRGGEWAKFFLDVWFDPLYRSYNFQRAEGHALEHLVQWHGTVLSKLALVPQKIINAYPQAQGELGYTDGDFVANFKDCERHQSCEIEMQPYFERFLTNIHSNEHER